MGPPEPRRSSARCERLPMASLRNSFMSANNAGSWCLG
jgi:hypothetical protein